MKFMTSIASLTLCLASSLAFALPKINTDVMTEVKNVDQIMQELQNYESRFWAIGLNGDTLQPDQFQRFFAARDLSFQYFVRSVSGVALGEMDAYQKDREVLKAYKSQVIKEELAEVERISQEIMGCKAKEEPVGFTGQEAAPDQFIKFFGERGLEIHYYVRGPGFNLGDAAAYDQNLQVLKDYASRLKELDETPAQR